MMKISKQLALMTVGVFALVGLSQIVLETVADARAGGGRSGGFRGSGRYQAPARPAQPAQPGKGATPPPATTTRRVRVSIGWLYARVGHRGSRRVPRLDAFFRVGRCRRFRRHRRL